MTSVYANKMPKGLEEDKAFWVNKEALDKLKGKRGKANEAVCDN